MTRRLVCSTIVALLLGALLAVVPEPAPQARAAGLAAASAVADETLDASTLAAAPGFVRTWGGAGAGDSQFNAPSGVAIDLAHRFDGTSATGNVYVADTGNHRVQEFTPSGGYLTQWGTYGTGNGQFRYPEGVGVGWAGDVYVTDGGVAQGVYSLAGSLQRFTNTGGFVSRTNGGGSDTAQLPWMPRGLAVSTAFRVYVLDTYLGYVHRYATFNDGILVWQDLWGRIGTGNGQFYDPAGVATDTAGNVYIVDQGLDRVQKFTATGTYLAQWGTTGSGNGQFDGPRGIAVDATGNVYVADTGNDRIQQFDTTGTYLTQWGTTGSGNGQFNAPRGVAVDATGNVYVADTGNNRIQQFADTTDPTIDLRTPAAGQVVEQGATVAADYSCADAGSGIASCTGTVAAGAPIDTSALGAHPFTVTATDRAGNDATVTHTYRVVAPPAQNGRIAFVSNRDGDDEIFVMNVDGSGQTQLTHNTDADTDPAWSPDGTQLVFTSTRDGNPEIYTMGADGTGATRLTTDAASDHQPAWSPTGTRIAFASRRDGNCSAGSEVSCDELYVMDADGSSQTRLTTSYNYDNWPAWSPDGARIAFTSARDDNAEIYAMDADGTHVTRLTDQPANDAQPAWSPDDRIAFFSARDGNEEIWVMATDGTGATQLTDSSPNNGGPAWSPDAAQLAFDTNRSGDFEIFRMAADGSGQTNLTATPGNDYSPAWQPVHDTSGPTVTLTTPADGATFTRGEAVTADFTCADAPAGVVSCTGTVPDGDPVDTATVGDHAFTVTATDNAGNSTTVTHHYTVVRASRLAGIVTEYGTGVPLEGTWVIALRTSDYGLAGGALTGADGRYTLPVDPGSYAIEFVDPEFSHVIEWYDGHGYRDLEQADPVLAVAGATTTVDADLHDPTGAVSGTVNEAGTITPLAGAVVAVLPVGVPRPLAATTTDTHGDYRIDGLPPGDYLVVTALPQGTHHTAFYGGTTDVNAAVPVTVTAGDTRPDTYLVMPALTGAPVVGQVTGNVTDDVTGRPEPGALVGVLRAADFGFTAATFTDQDGNYSLGVGGGDHYLETFDLDTGHRFEWYDDQQTPGAWSELTTVFTSSTADTALTPLEGNVAGTITEAGTGTPLAGIWVALIGYDTGQPVAGTTTDASGHYSLPAIDIGDYYEVFIDPTGTHTLEFEHDTGNMGAASRVAVTGGHTTAVDADLTPTT